VERNRKAGQNPPRVVAPSEEVEDSLHKTSLIVCLISGLCSEADEIRTLLDIYAAYDGNF
jgi:hypothetical protein